MNQVNLKKGAELLGSEIIRAAQGADEIVLEGGVRLPGRGKITLRGALDEVGEGAVSRDRADIISGMNIEAVRECPGCGAEDVLVLRPPMFWFDWDLPHAPPMRTALEYVRRVFEEGVEVAGEVSCVCALAGPGQNP